MNIEFIKWMVGYAEGFEEVGFGGLITYDRFSTCRFKDLENWFLYPLLRQRAIENVGAVVSICSKGYIEIGDPDDPYMIKVSDFKNIDKAKEQALKYIYNQEAE